MIITSFDTETTGLIENRTMKTDKLPEIIELYACHFDDQNGEIVDELNLMIRPRIEKLPEEIVKITAINDAMLVNKPGFLEVADRIEQFLTSTEVITGHNLSYDTEMVEIEFSRIGRKFKGWPARQLCTIEQTNHLRGFRLNLSSLHEFLFEQPFSGSHRAKADVMAQVRCFMELRKREEI